MAAVLSDDDLGIVRQSADTQDQILQRMSENERVAKRPFRWMVAFLWALGTCALAPVIWFLLRPASPV